MTEKERETFLADLRAGILSAAGDDRPPLTVPIRYGYEPGGNLFTGAQGRKARKTRLIQEAGVPSLSVQREECASWSMALAGGVWSRRTTGSRRSMPSRLLSSVSGRGDHPPGAWLRPNMDRAPRRASHYRRKDTVVTRTPIDAFDAAPVAPTVPRVARWLALGAIAGPLLFTCAWLVLGLLSPGYTLFGTRITPYSAISQPISGLGLGPTGPFMNAAFVVGGLLLLAGVVGVFWTIAPDGRPAARRACAALLALSPLGMVVAGIFTLEAVFPHLIGFLLAVATPVVSFLAAGRFLRSIPRWRRFGKWLLWGSPPTLVLVFLFFWTFDPVAAGAGRGVAGLTQRVLSVEVHAWFVAMGWLAFRRPKD